MFVESSCRVTGPERPGPLLPLRVGQLRIKLKSLCPLPPTHGTGRFILQTAQLIHHMVISTIAVRGKKGRLPKVETRDTLRRRVGVHDGFEQ